MVPAQNAATPSNVPTFPASANSPLPLLAPETMSDSHELRAVSTQFPEARVPDGNAITTTILVSNLHCFSCRSTIEGLISSLSPAPLEISINILEHRVVVAHLQDLSPRDIIRVLIEAAFEIDSASTTGCAQRSSMGALSGESIVSFQGDTHDWLEEMQDRLRLVVSGGKRASNSGLKHLEICELCRNEAATAEAGREKEYKYGDSSRLSMHSVLKDARRASMSHTLSFGPTSFGPSEKTMLAQATDGSITHIAVSQAIHVPEPADGAGGLHEAFLSVGGMTCASCSNRVTEVLEVLPSVQSVSVNLMGNSAVVILDVGTIGEAELCAKRLVSEVEDSGFDCSLEAVKPLGVEGDVVVKGQMGVEREVALKVEGMFCDHCPEKVMAVLGSAFPGQLLSIDVPITRSSAIVHIRYTPRPPSFTLRHIAAEISSISPGFVVSVHHPPTMEQRSRQLQLRERNRLLVRLIICIFIALPTFMIGIVWMTLVPKENRIRRYLQRPMWSGSVTRAVWALFFLSTLVMFFVADVFHKRAIHEIRALWRKGSSVPVMRRFYRFGSMNLLISLGVSISYFSSVALLALDAVGPKEQGGIHLEPEPEPVIHTTTYFDSTVFLTMFLLAGRFLEAYSKSNTADAVNLLGKLRPSEALLVVSAGEEDLAADVTAFKATPTQSPIGGNDPSNTDYSDNRPWKSRTISTDLLEVGDIISVVRGSSPPADGTVISGRSQFDESSLTGEARLVPKSEGDFVYAGTINQGQVVNIRVDCIGGDSMLDQIVKVVREGQTRRAPIERLADVITGYFVPVVTLLAIITWLLWLTLGMSGALPDSYLDVDQGGWPVWSLGFAIAVFVIACPCGIGLAAPTALFVGSGLAARFGILAKGGGEAFQEASWLDCIVFDKTGTLTQGGEPEVTDARILVEDAEARKITYAISQRLEEGSAHPLARAVVAHCEGKGVVDMATIETEETPGRGLSGVFRLTTGETFEAIIGNERLMEENGATGITQHENVLDEWKSSGKSVVLLAIKKRGGLETDIYGPEFKLTALFGAADPLRPEAPEVVKSLQDDGISVWMISGDNPKTAIAVASIVGIPPEKVIAGVLPTEKAEKIKLLQETVPKRLRSRWHRMVHRKDANKSKPAVVAMVGDGINDAPALSTADVGIAIGSGSDVAIGSAKFILVSSDLRSLLTLIDLSRAVFRRVKFNFLWACIYNLVALPVAAGVLYPIGGERIRLDPVWAALAMAFSSVSVVCSSLLLKTRLLGVGFRSRQERYRR